MGKVQRGVIKPPNEATTKGNRINSCGPMTHGAPATKAPNAKLHDGNINNGFLPMTKKKGDVKGSNESNKFSVENARIGYDGTEGTVVSPGHGAVPVNPFQDKTGNPNFLVAAMRDSAKK